MEWTEQQLRDFELAMISWARDCPYDKLEVAKAAIDYVIEDKFLKEIRLRGQTK